jgi:hypothetical protein
MEDRIFFVKTAYKKAYGLGLVRNKADFAIKVGVNVNSMSKALNGDGSYATENLCKKIRDAFPTIEIIGNFSPSITGNGNTQVVGDNSNAAPTESKPAQASDVLALSQGFLSALAKKDEHIDRLLGLLEATKKQ